MTCNAAGCVAWHSCKAEEHARNVNCPPYNPRYKQFTLTRNQSSMLTTAVTKYQLGVVLLSSQHTQNMLDKAGVLTTTHSPMQPLSKAYRTAAWSNCQYNMSNTRGTRETYFSLADELDSVSTFTIRYQSRLHGSRPHALLLSDFPSIWGREDDTHGREESLPDIRAITILINDVLLELLPDVGKEVGEDLISSCHEG
jgi:hypothetical protein